MCPSIIPHVTPRSTNLTPILVPPLLFPLPIPLGFLPLSSTSSHLYPLPDGGFFPFFPYSPLPVSLFILQILFIYFLWNIHKFLLLPFFFSSSWIRFLEFFLLFFSSPPPFFYLPSFCTHTHTVNGKFTFLLSLLENVARRFYPSLSTVYLWSLVMRNNRVEDRGRNIGAGETVSRDV